MPPAASTQALDAPAFTVSPEEIRTAILRARTPGAAVNDFITAAVVRFDDELPGYLSEVDEDGLCGDNYYEAGFAFIASKLVAEGLDPASYETEIYEALDWIRDRSATATRAAFEGGGREELLIASAYRAERDRLTEIVLHKPHLIEARIIPSRRSRARTSRAAPLRRRGSRRGASASSRAGPGDSDPDLADEGDHPPQPGRITPALAGGAR